LTLIEEAEVPIKHIVRKGCHVLYLKVGEQIADYLALIGAQKAALAFHETLIFKEIRNSVNRRTNCESANMGKTAAAAAEQLRAVQHIADNGGLAQLPPELEELARLRLEHPEYSLRELAESFDPPLSRSGINHRLRRIAEFAATV